MTDTEKEEVRLELLACTFADEAALPGWRAVQPEEDISAGQWERGRETVPPGSQFRDAAIYLTTEPGLWRLVLPNVNDRKPSHFVEGASPRALMRLGSEKIADLRWLLDYHSARSAFFRFPATDTQRRLHSVYPTTAFGVRADGTLFADDCKACEAALADNTVRLPELALQRLDWLVHFETRCGLSVMFIAVRDGPLSDADLWTWSYTAETGWGEAVCVPASAADIGPDPAIIPNPNTPDLETPP